MKLLYARLTQSNVNNNKAAGKIYPGGRGIGSISNRELQRPFWGFAINLLVD